MTRSRVPFFNGMPGRLEHELQGERHDPAWPRRAGLDGASTLTQVDHVVHNGYPRQSNGGPLKADCIGTMEINFTDGSPSLHLRSNLAETCPGCSPGQPNFSPARKVSSAIPASKPYWANRLVDALGEVRWRLKTRKILRRSQGLSKLSAAELLTDGVGGVLENGRQLPDGSLPDSGGAEKRQS